MGRSSVYHNLPSSSHVQERNGLWKAIWLIKVPRKILFFLWQCCYDRIPVQANLRARGIPVDPSCYFCGEEEETVCHLLFRCRFSQMVWNTSPLRIEEFDPSLTKWSQIWLHLNNFWSHSHHSVELSSLGALLCWHIWKAKNDGVFKNIRRDVAEVVSIAVSDLSDFDAVFKFKDFFSPVLDRHLSAPSQWSPPPVGFLKLNLDVSFSSIFLECGGGIILRDELGRPIKIASLFFHRVSNVELAEALVLRESLKLAHAWGYSKVIFEGDCKSVMSLRPNAIFVSVVLEDFASMFQVMEGCSLSWIPRSCSSVAHSLTHRALKSRSSDLPYGWPDNYQQSVADYRHVPATDYRYVPEVTDYRQTPTTADYRHVPTVTDYRQVSTANYRYVPTVDYRQVPIVDYRQTPTVADYRQVSASDYRQVSAANY
ncbi:uncharacterized protein LOC132296274 [Cornus florida]|uniref:uncharacterized protein LOC132296274 n=1 Tax=Cornus florida TaxID=4283 RepID=UPI00289FC630|nr:uncharacterized protein LOC132296274 [Cornus florida]